MNNENERTDKMLSKKRHVTGISWRLFGTLIVFVSLVLIVIWFFQVVLLNRFYENSKLEEFADTESHIFDNIGNADDLKKEVFLRSVETDTCIKVFEIRNGVAQCIADADVYMGCYLHHTNSDSFYQLYVKAKEEGGVYVRKIASHRDKSDALTTIRVSLIEDGDGNEYLVIQDSELIPLNATVKTLERQFGWIMCFLIMGALVVALIMSRFVCLPIERMSRSAKMLAKGDYDIDFSAGGYREVEELADALNYAAEELAKNDNLQKELVANVSHDLRTPLTMIKGYSEVMRDIPGENTPENVQVIIDETERLTELVNDILDLSKIKSGTRKPEKEIFDLTETVGAVLLRYEKFKEKEKYVINFEKSDRVEVNADRTMILQVVYNLVNNALNYTGEDKTVTIKQTILGNQVRISVTDSGEGIAKEDIPYIWDRYYKVDKVHKRAVVGTGLGLAIVKSILEAHGASYGVESQVGEGTTFYFDPCTV